MSVIFGNFEPKSIFFEIFILLVCSSKFPVIFSGISKFSSFCLNLVQISMRTQNYFCTTKKNNTQNEFEIPLLEIDSTSAMTNGNNEAWRLPKYNKLILYMCGYMMVFGLLIYGVRILPRTNYKIWTYALIICTGILKIFLKYFASKLDIIRMPNSSKFRVSIEMWSEFFVTALYYVFWRNVLLYFDTPHISWESFIIAKMTHMITELFQTSRMSMCIPINSYFWDFVVLTSLLRHVRNFSKFRTKSTFFEISTFVVSRKIYG